MSHDGRDFAQGGSRAGAPAPAPPRPAGAVRVQYVSDVHLETMGKRLPAFEDVARPGSEENIDNEKYEFKQRDWAAAAKAGTTLAARKASCMSVPRPGPSSTRRMRGGAPMATQVSAAQSPINSPNIWLISGAVVKSPSTPKGSRVM